jgi:hypothetical protein
MRIGGLETSMARVVCSRRTMCSWMSRGLGMRIGVDLLGGVFQRRGNRSLLSADVVVRQGTGALSSRGARRWKCKSVCLRRLG